MKTIEVSGHEIVLVENGLYLVTKCHRCGKQVDVPMKTITAPGGIVGSNKEMATWCVITQYHDTCRGKEIDLDDRIVQYGISNGMPGNASPDFLPSAAMIDFSLSFDPKP